MNARTIDYKSRDAAPPLAVRTPSAGGLASLTISATGLVVFPVYDAVMRPPGVLQERVIVCAMMACVLVIFLGVLDCALRGGHWQAKLGIVLAVVASAMLPMLARS